MRRQQITGVTSKTNTSAKVSSVLSKNNATKRHQPKLSDMQKSTALYGSTTTTRNISKPSSTTSSSSIRLASQPHPQIALSSNSSHKQTIVGKKTSNYSSYGIPSEYEGDANADIQLFQCKNCGRKFNSQSLAKHQKVCKKVFMTQAKPRDMRAKRMPKEALFAQKKSTTSGTQLKKKSTWRMQHHQFMLAMKQSRGVSLSFKEQEQQNALSQQMDTRKQCPVCGRKFNEDRLEKHVAICKKISAKNKFVGSSSSGAPKKVPPSMSRGRISSAGSSVIPSKGNTSKNMQMSGKTSGIKVSQPTSRISSKYKK